MGKATILNKAHKSIEELLQDTLGENVNESLMTALLNAMNAKMESLIMSNTDYKKDLEFLGFPISPGHILFGASCYNLSSDQQVTLLKYLIVREKSPIGSDILDQVIARVKAKDSEPYNVVSDNTQNLYDSFDNFVSSLDEKTSGEKKSGLKKLGSFVKVAVGSRSDSLEREAIHAELVPLLQRIKPFCTELTLPRIIESIENGDMNSSAFVKYYKKVANDRDNPKNQDLYGSWEALKGLAQSILAESSQEQEAPEPEGPPQPRSQRSVVEPGVTEIPKTRLQGSEADSELSQLGSSHNRGGNDDDLKRAIDNSLKSAQEHDDKVRSEQIKLDRKEKKDISAASKKYSCETQLFEAVKAIGRKGGSDSRGASM